ncbi:AbrB/MazE/SpoVT family DNA-binding domain-containing protein [Metallosphaera javensis (ex Sakai et al. 2022)]|uniref:AbrB/MazE/SpoVT family DNA-binding domain-containing protein n=1 Tax=Metallosphaera javensis (ex Sakai et al. 2022) TaxID=2775498 RepID=UPI003CE4B593
MREGDIVEITLNNDEIVIRKARSRRPRIKLNRKLTVDEVERDIEEGMNEGSG